MMEDASLFQFSRCFIKSTARHLSLQVLALFCFPVVVYSQPGAMFSSKVTDGLGVNIHFTNPRPGEMKMLAESGVKWVRMDFGWEHTERQKGQYNFADYDRLMKELDEHKLRAVLILDYSNKLYEVDQSVATEEGRQAFARWAAAAVKHFKGHGVVWEIWNEPNIGFWKPEPNVAQYIALAKAACVAMRAAEPHELIVGPATSEVPLNFLEACFQGGLLEFWDAVTVHPYRQIGPESVVVEYHRLRQLIAKYAPQGKKVEILSGEWGYSSAWQSMDDDRQGKMLARQWLTNMSHRIPVSIWYDWHDDGTDAKEAEHHFGTVKFPYYEGRDPVYDPKPAYIAAKTLTSMFKGCDFVKRLAIGDQDDYVVLCRDQQKLALAVWTVSPYSHQMVIPSEGTLRRAVSYLGEKYQPIDIKPNQLTVKASGSPIYLEFDSNAKLLENPELHPLHATIAPTEDFLHVTVGNLGSGPFDGRIRLTDVYGVQVNQPGYSFNLKDASDTLTVQIPWRQLYSSFRFGLLIENPQRTVMWSGPTRLYVPAANWSFSNMHVIADGDPKVSGEATVQSATIEVPFPSSKEPSAQLKYQFGDGWKFFNIAIKGDRGDIPGRPTAFGVWIHGDGKNAVVRMRVSDSTHQTWQIGGPRIDWTGWKYVELPLSPSSAHWGGANDGEIHYPLKWEASFLLDNPSRRPLSGEIQFSRPITIE